ncbi:MAG: cysteine synthase A, partial [Bacteroidaceae bacterium]|nr:cysteine synthase A [Bacteroidaceae bacterium]
QLEAEEQLEATLLAKLESFNPGGSAKDRVALAMIERAEEQGVLRPGGLIVEPTSGNTGVGLAWIGSVKGYRVILTMPDTMSVERQRLVRAYGAEVVLTPGDEGMAGAIRRAEEIIATNEGSFMPMQFENPSNPAAHRATTAQEIWNDTDGQVDIFVAGIGTAGTLCGTAQGLKEHNPQVRVIGVEPAGCPLLTGGEAGCHKIQGIGANFIPRNYDATVVDEVIDVTDEDAYRGARRLTRYGILSGISAGAALHAAIEVARRADSRGKTIVILLPDTGERYLSTGVFE